MGSESLTGRSVNLGLKFGAHDPENYNWTKLDDILGNAFTQGSFLQLPPNSVGPAQIQPQTITSDLIFVSGTLVQSLAQLPTTEQTITTANGAQVLLSQDMGSTRYGPIFLSGNIPIQVSNATAGAVQFTVDLHARIFGVFVPIISPSLQWTANPNTTATIFVPVSTFLDCAGNFSGNFAGTLIQLVAQMDSGPTTATVVCRAGIVTFTEFA